MKAKGKRLHTWEIQNVEELEPLRFPEKNDEEEAAADASEEDASQENDQPTLF